jgi:DNA ligase-1
MSVALIEGLEQATAYAETGYMHDGIIHVPGEEPLWTGRKLYKVDSAGKLRAWFMQRQGHNHRVVAGIDGGSLVENAWTACVSKGKGKAQTTPEEQAIKEVDALYRKALDRDYYETPEEASGPARNYLPMLAESWKATTWEKWLDRVAKAGIDVPIDKTGAFFQPKLDGYCCIARDQGLQSREGLAILTAEHIMDLLAPVRRRHPNKPLHGELYNHDLKDEFEKLGSLLKKQKGITPEHIAEVASKVQYHIYDWPGWGEEKPFGERSYALYQELADLGVWGDSIHCVPTTAVRDAEHLLELTSLAVEDGYEGGIGRLHLPLREGQAILVCGQDQDLRRRRVRGRPDRGRQGQLRRLCEAGDLLAAGRRSLRRSHEGEHLRGRHQGQARPMARRPAARRPQDRHHPLLRLHPRRHGQAAHGRRHQVARR